MIGSDQVNTTIDTKYSAEGTKPRKEYKNTSIGISNTTWTKEITDYLDGFQYVNRTSSDGGGDMEFFSVPLETSFAYEQHAFSNELTDITQVALNLQHPELQFFPTAEGYKYNGKELQENSPTIINSNNAIKEHENARQYLHK